MRNPRFKRNRKNKPRARWDVLKSFSAFPKSYGNISEKIQAIKSCSSPRPENEVICFDNEIIKFQKEQIERLEKSNRSLEQNCGNLEKMYKMFEISISVRIYIENIFKYCLKKLAKLFPNSKFNSFWSFDLYCKKQSIGLSQKNEIIQKIIKKYDLNLDQWKELIEIKDILNGLMHEKPVIGKEAIDSLEFLPEILKKYKTLLQEITVVYNEKEKSLIPIDNSDIGLPKKRPKKS